MQKCAHCTHRPAHYCSRACQQRHWRVHRHVCQSRVSLSDHIEVRDGGVPIGTNATGGGGDAATTSAAAADDTATPASRTGPFNTEELAAYSSASAQLRAATAELAELAEKPDGDPAVAAATAAKATALEKRIADIGAELEASPIHAMATEYERLDATDYAARRERSTDATFDRLFDGAAAMPFEAFGERDIDDISDYLEAVIGDVPRAEPVEENGGGGGATADFDEDANIAKDDWDGLRNLERAYRDLARRTLADADRANALPRDEFDMLDAVRRNIEDLIDSKTEFARVPTRTLKRRTLALQRTVDTGLIDAGKRLGALPASTPNYAELPRARLDADADLAVLAFDMRMQRVLSFGSATLVAESERIVAALRAAVDAEAAATGAQRAATTQLMEDIAEKFADVAKRAGQVNIADADTRIIADALSGAAGDAAAQRRADQITAQRRAAEAAAQRSKDRTQSMPPNALPGVLEPGSSASAPPEAAPAAAQLVGANGDDDGGGGSASGDGDAAAAAREAAIEALNELLVESSSWTALNGVASQFFALVAQLDEIGGGGGDDGDRIADTQPALAAMLDTLRQMSSIVDMYKDEPAVRGTEMTRMLEMALVYTDGGATDAVKRAAERRHEGLLRFLDSTTVRTLGAVLLLATAARTTANAPDVSTLIPSTAILPAGPYVHTPAEFAPSLAACTVPFQNAAIVTAGTVNIDAFTAAHRESTAAYTNADGSSRIADCVTFDLREDGAVVPAGGDGDGDKVSCDARRRDFAALIDEVASYHPELFNGNSLDEFRTVVVDASQRGDAALEDVCGTVMLTAARDANKGALFLRHLRAARFEQGASRHVNLVGDLVRRVFKTVLDVRPSEFGDVAGEIEQAREQLERTDQALAFSSLWAALYRIETRLRNKLFARQAQAFTDRGAADEAVAAAATAGAGTAGQPMTHMERRALVVADFIKDEVRPAAIEFEKAVTRVDEAVAAAATTTTTTTTRPDENIATLRLRESVARRLLSARITALQSKFADPADGGTTTPDLFVYASNSALFSRTLPTLVDFFRQETASAPVFSSDEQREIVFGALVSAKALDISGDGTGLDRSDVQNVGGERFVAAMMQLYEHLIEIAARSHTLKGQAAVLVMRRWLDLLAENSAHDAIYLMRQMKTADELAFTEQELGVYLTNVEATGARATLGALRNYYETLPSALNIMGRALLDNVGSGTTGEGAGGGDDVPAAIGRVESVVRHYETDVFAPSSHALRLHTQQSGDTASTANVQANVAFRRFVARGADERSPRLQRSLERLADRVDRAPVQIKTLNESISWFSALLALLLSRKLLGIETLLRLERRRRVEQIAENALASFQDTANRVFARWRRTVANDTTRGDDQQRRAVAAGIERQARMFNDRLQKARDQLRATHNVAMLNATWRVFTSAALTGTVALSDYFVITRLAHISYAASAYTPLLGWLLKPFVGHAALGYAALTVCTAMQTAVVVPVHRMAATVIRRTARSTQPTPPGALVDAARTVARTENLIETALTAIFAGALTALAPKLGAATAGGPPSGTTLFEYDSVWVVVLVGMFALATRAATASAEVWWRQTRQKNKNA